MATFGTFVANQTLTAAELNAGTIYQDYTPTWTQNVAITKTVNWARFTRFGGLVVASIQMTATGAGTASNTIKVGLPVNASANNFLMGVCQVVDESSTPDGAFHIYAVYDTASTIAFMNSNGGSAADASVRFGNSFTLAAGDIIRINLTYEA
jgi:hypothetical protein